MVARTDFLTYIPFTDHGVSDDAKRLRNLFYENPSRSPSIKLEGRFREASEAINSASKEASEDNWDGYGAQKIHEASLENAQAFLFALPTIIPLPEVSVDPDGEVSFTWQRSPRLVFSVSVSKNGVLNYAGLFGRNKTHGTEDFIQAIPKAITNNLERLFSTEE